MTMQDNTTITKTYKKLYKHQKDAIQFLISHSGGLLCDEQGLGKTITALEFLKAVFKEPEPESRIPENPSKTPSISYQNITVQQSLQQCYPVPSILIICPAIMRSTWSNEINDYKARTSVFNNTVVYSYEYITKHVSNLISSVFDAIVLDEAHYIKTPTSKRTKSCLSFLRKSTVKYKLLLTGTPVTRDIDDLYPLLDVFYNNNPMYPNWYKNVYSFRTKLMHCTYNGFAYVYKGFKDDDAKSRLLAYMKPVMIRRTKKDTLNDLSIPPIVHNTIYVDIDKKVANKSLEYVDFVINNILSNESDKQLRDTTITLTNYQDELSSVSSIRRILGVAKVKPVMDYIKYKLESTNKLVCFCVHKQVIESLKDVLIEDNPKLMVSVIDGNTSPKNKDEIIQNFQDDSENHNHKHIIISNILAGGVGITLTKSHSVVFAELDWTPSNIMQAEARCHRISQEHTVTSDFIIAKDSLDSNIVKIILEKTKIIKKILD